MEGLFPLKASNPYLVFPCIYPPTKWVRRHLTGAEFCKVKDVPEDLISKLISSEIATICQDSSLLPLKVLQRALDVIPTITMKVADTGCS
jgi:hypothetical protein